MEIVGRYMLTERMAQGGTAEVYRARAHGVEGFRKAVAIKRLRRDVPTTADDEARFARQASLALSLQHANVVQAFDFGTSAGAVDEPPRHYLVMELVEGVTLAELLSYFRATRARMPLTMAAFVGAEIARALDYAHRRTDDSGALLGLVHRDLAPANVLLSVEGEVKVTDFGADPSGYVDIEPSEAPASLSMARVAGTSAYMSPEQARGEVLDAASDLYSLGTILYECVTGANPFTGASAAETRRRVRASEAPPAELLYPELPEAVLAILRSAMDPDPISRRSRAGAGVLADELTWLCFEDAECSPGASLAAAVEACIRWRDEPANSDGTDKPTHPPPASMPAPSERVSARRVHATVVVVSMHHGENELAARAVAALERAGAHVALRDAPRVVGVLVHEDGAGDELERAVRAAWWVSNEGTDASARVGVASGIVTVDLDGVPRDGDDLATLSRAAESVVPAGMGGVYISPAVATGVRHAFRIDELEDAFDVLRVVEAYGLSGRMGPFCGHRTELRALWESLARASKGTTEVLHVKGPTGIGKTRLLLEHAARASGRLPDLRVEVAACPKDNTVAYAVIAGMIDTWARGNLRSLAERLLKGGLKSADVGEALVAFEGGAEPTETRTMAVCRFVGALLSDVRVQGPLLLAFDDADEMDAGSAEVLAHVLGETEDLRASVVFLSRHALPAPLQALDARRVDVFELDREPSDRLALGLWEASSAPRELLDFVWDNSRGQPRLIECLVTALRDGGHVRVERGKVTVSGDLSSAPVPLPVRMYFLSAYEQLKPLRHDMTDVVGVLGHLATRSRVASVLRVLGHDEQEHDITRSFGILAHRGLVTDTDPSSLSPGLAADWATSLGTARRRAIAMAVLVTSESDETLATTEDWIGIGDLAESVAELESAARAFGRALAIARAAGAERDVARASAAMARVLREEAYNEQLHAELVLGWSAASRALSGLELSRDAAGVIRGLERIRSIEVQTSLALAIARALRGRDAEAERARALTFALSIEGNDASVRADVERELAMIGPTSPPSSGVA